MWPVCFWKILKIEEKIMTPALTLLCWKNFLTWPRVCGLRAWFRRLSPDPLITNVI